jgi:hypothetical protein
VLRPGATSSKLPGAPPLEAVFDFSAEGIRGSLAASGVPGRGSSAALRISPS